MYELSIFRPAKEAKYKINTEFLNLFSKKFLSEN